MNKLILILGTIFLNTGFCADATMQVKAGDSFTLSRPENAGSTGYSWSQTISNPAIVTFKAKEFKPSEMMPGAPGTAYFTFQAVQIGSTTIRLQLRRPWETKEAPAETYTVDVTVIK